ncbi:MAG: hypothetical protein FJ191_13840 [Gammaproteobacteria bacterium]|nr:hypothetical protein [Gammaproteobacteria bacterium]
MRLMWVVAVGVAVWPDHALAAACAAPSLPSGQEAAIQAAFEPGPAAPAGLRAGDIAVQRDRLIVAWQGHGDPWVWLVRHEAAATGGVRAGNLVAHLASPCQRHGAVDAASFGGAALAAAATTATCPDGAVEVETAFAARLAVAAGAIRWSCAEGDGDAGSPKVGRLLRDLDERLRVADRPSADAALAALADPTLAAGVDLASRIDLGVALWRHGQRDIAHGHLRPALAAWQAVHTPQPPAATADRWVWVRQAERAAAAMVALGEEARGAAVLNACWQALPSTRGEPACSALAFAAALEHSGHGDDAAEWLDLQIARAEPPEADWLRARIGLASRQDDARAELKTAERAVRAWPRDLDLQDSLATACFRAGRRSPSRPPFRPERRPVRFLGRLGDCQNRLGSVSSGSIQRIAQTALWLRSSRAAPDRRSLCPRWAGLNGTGTTGTGGDWHRTARKRRNTAKWTGGATEQTSVSGRDPGSGKLSHG